MSGRINIVLLKKAMLLLTTMAILTIAPSPRADTGTCGGQMITLPFTDVPSSNSFFCAIAQSYLTGLTNGTSPTTYSPQATVTREQMAAFVTRTLDQSLKRGSARAALDQFWTTKVINNRALTTVGDGPLFLKSDGADLWVASGSSDTVSRVRASDGKLLETWTGATNADAVLVAMGRIFVTGLTDPGGSLYQIDPTQAAGAVTTLTSGLGRRPQSIAFDGQRIWTANVGTGIVGTGSVSIITLNSGAPPTITNVTGFGAPAGMLYDGANIWVTDAGAPGTLKKLDSNGAVIQTVSVGNFPASPVFDGTNIWVPNSTSHTVSVVRASSGVVLTTLSSIGSTPVSAAFDGERVLVTNTDGDNVSLWKATDLTPIGTVSTGANSQPIGACSDGLNFWITLSGTGKLARF